MPATIRLQFHAVATTKGRKWGRYSRCCSRTLRPFAGTTRIDKLGHSKRTKVEVLSLLFFFLHRLSLRRSSAEITATRTASARTFYFGLLSAWHAPHMQETLLYV